MVKKSTAERVSSSNPPAHKKADGKRTPTLAVVQSSLSESPKTIEKWPVPTQLLEQAQASLNLAETLRQNILTTDPNCPLRLPTVSGNWYAIQEALNRVVNAYAIEAPFPNTQFPTLVRVAGTCILGWGHLVAIPARNLIRAINGLLIYFDRAPLTRELPFFGPHESPPKVKRGTSRNRKDDGLPIEWLNSVRYLAKTLTEELNKRLPHTLGNPGYLGLTVNKDRQTVCREGFDPTVKFFGSTEWELFVAIHGAGERGLTREEINKLSGEQTGKRNLKLRLKTTLIPLSLTIPNGQWKLVDMNVKAANQLKASRGSDVSCSGV